jgi:hypothetical protein
MLLNQLEAGACECTRVRCGKFIFAVAEVKEATWELSGVAFVEAFARCAS